MGRYPMKRALFAALAIVIACFPACSTDNGDGQAPSSEALLSKARRHFEDPPKDDPPRRREINQAREILEELLSGKFEVPDSLERDATALLGEIAYLQHRYDEAVSLLAPLTAEAAQDSAAARRLWLVTDAHFQKAFLYQELAAQFDAFVRPYVDSLLNRGTRHEQIIRYQGARSAWWAGDTERAKRLYAGMSPACPLVHSLSDKPLQLSPWQGLGSFQERWTPSSTQRAAITSLSNTPCDANAASWIGRWRRKVAATVNFHQGDVDAALRCVNAEELGMADFADGDAPDGRACRDTVVYLPENYWLISRYEYARGVQLGRFLEGSPLDRDTRTTMRLAIQQAYVALAMEDSVRAVARHLREDPSTPEVALALADFWVDYAGRDIAAWLVSPERISDYPTITAGPLMWAVAVSHPQVFSRPDWMEQLRGLTEYLDSRTRAKRHRQDIPPPPGATAVWAAHMRLAHSPALLPAQRQAFVYGLVSSLDAARDMNNIGDLVTPRNDPMILVGLAFLDYFTNRGVAWFQAAKHYETLARRYPELCYLKAIIYDARQM